MKRLLFHCRKYEPKICHVFEQFTACEGMKKKINNDVKSNRWRLKVIAKIIWYTVSIQGGLSLCGAKMDWGSPSYQHVWENHWNVSKQRKIGRDICPPTEQNISETFQGNWREFSVSRTKSKSEPDTCDLWSLRWRRHNERCVLRTEEERELPDSYQQQVQKAGSGMTSHCFTPLGAFSERTGHANT